MVKTRKISSSFLFSLILSIRLEKKEEEEEESNVYFDVLR
jgi:hypothetical protein